MKQKEFDDYIRDSFEKASLPYNADNWKKLSTTLNDQRERKRRIILWPLASIAASIAMAIGINVWMNHDTPKPMQAHKIEIVTQPAAKESKIEEQAPSTKPEAVPASNPVINTVHVSKTKLHKPLVEEVIET